MPLDVTEWHAGRALGATEWQQPDSYHHPCHSDLLWCYAIDDASSYGRALRGNSCHRWTRTSRMSPMALVTGWRVRSRAWDNVLPSCFGRPAVLGVTGRESFFVPSADRGSLGSSNAGPVRTVGHPLGVSAKDRKSVV